MHSEDRREAGRFFALRSLGHSTKAELVDHPAMTRQDRLAMHVLAMYRTRRAFDPAHEIPPLDMLDYKCAMADAQNKLDELCAWLVPWKQSAPGSAPRSAPDETTQRDGNSLDEALAARLVRLRPALINILGFYDLLDSDEPRTPLQTMQYEVHFTASSIKVAREVMEIVNELLDEAGF